jgi:uncharacterized membrane protein YeaQ/YmgE (transglycosylase-associated protein family)
MLKRGGSAVALLLLFTFQFIILNPYKEVYIIPAILGSLAIVVFAVDLIKTCATVFKEEKEPVPKKGG